MEGVESSLCVGLSAGRGEAHGWGESGTEPWCGLAAAKDPS